MQVFDRPILDRNRPDVAKRPGIVQAHVQLSGLPVEIRARQRAERAVRDVFVRRRGILTDCREVRILEPAFEIDPVRPGALERHAVHPAELRGVIRAAAPRSRRPPNERLGRVGVGEIIHEPSAVQIRVCFEPEIGLRQFRREAERVIESAAVPYHRPEDHLIVRPLCPPKPSGHPRVEEDGNSLQIPPRRRPSGARHVEVADRLGVLGRRGDFAEEQPAKQSIGTCGTIRGCHMNQLVVHQVIHPLVCGEGLECEAERRNLDGHQVARHRLGAGVAEVGEVRQENGNFLRRREVEDLSLKRERVFERAADMGGKKRLRGLQVGEVEVGRLDRGELREARHRVAEHDDEHDQSSEERGVKLPQDTTERHRASAWTSITATAIAPRAPASPLSLIAHSRTLRSRAPARTRCFQRRA